MKLWSIQLIFRITRYCARMGVSKFLIVERVKVVLSMVIFVSIYKYIKFVRIEESVTNCPLSRREFGYLAQNLSCGRTVQIGLVPKKCNRAAVPNRSERSPI